MKKKISRECFIDVVDFFYYMCFRVNIYYIKLNNFLKKLLKLKKKKIAYKKKEKIRGGKKIKWIDYKKKLAK